MWPVGRRRIRGFALASIVTALALQATPAHATAPNDEYWSRQWGPPAIHVEDAWNAGATAAGIKVGIVDTGVEIGRASCRERV